MKTIERLRELLAKATGPYDSKVDPWMDQRFKARDECLVALPALLAVVEAQAAEIRAWREHRRLHDLRSATCHDAESWNAYKKPREKVWYELLAARDNTDAAIRALEGGE